MAVKFLSPEWAAEAASALNSHQGFKTAIGNADLGIVFNVTGAPEGEVSYYLKTTGGQADLGLGSLDSPDVTVGSSYDTAASISKGELNTQTAFMTGKLKVKGDMGAAMKLQKLF